MGKPCRVDTFHIGDVMVGTKTPASISLSRHKYRLSFRCSTNKSCPRQFSIISFTQHSILEVNVFLYLHHRSCILSVWSKDRPPHYRPTDNILRDVSKSRHAIINSRIGQWQRLVLPKYERIAHNCWSFRHVSLNMQFSARQPDERPVQSTMKKFLYVEQLYWH
jgi:hypothetical protein